MPQQPGYSYVVGDQSFVFETMADPETHGGMSVRRIDTPTSVLFAVGDSVYKLCRAVMFPGRDFSSLGKRQMALEEEFARGRESAPWLYQDLLPLVRNCDNKLVIGGGGPVIEWALKLAHYDERDTFDALEASGALSSVHIRQLAFLLADSHLAAPIAEGRRYLAWLDSYLGQGNMGDAMPEHRPMAARHAEVAHQLAERVREQRTLILQRGHHGFVRLCHGRAFLNRTLMHEGKPQLVSPATRASGGRAVDVLHDLAAPLVDLLRLGRADGANILLNSYIWRTRRDDDLDALRLLPLMMGMRALEAADYCLLRSAPSTGAGTDDARHLPSMQFLEIAENVLRARKPALIVVGGLSGTGKSTLAHHLAPGLGALPGAVVLRSDVERKLLFGVDPADRLDAHAYEPEMTQAVYRILACKTRRTLAAGHSVVVDAVCALPEERAMFAALAESQNARMTGIWLDADEQTRLARVSGRGDDVSDANADVVRQQSSYDLGTMNFMRIDARASEDAVFSRVRALSASVH